MSSGDADLAKLFHDLRSPLMAITGAFSVLEAGCGDLPPHARRALEAGLRATGTLDGRLRELEAHMRAASPRDP